MYRLLRLPVRRTSTANAFFRTYASQQTTPSLTEGEQHIFDKLTKELEPSELLVQDVSGLHAAPFSAICFVLINTCYGTCGIRTVLCMRAPCLGGCGSFYAITIASEKLKGLPILKQHRRIKNVLKDDMAELHGLQVRRLNSPMTNYLTDFRASVLS